MGQQMAAAYMVVVTSCGRGEEAEEGGQCWQSVKQNHAIAGFAAAYMVVVTSCCRGRGRGVSVRAA
jgi:hypothetical protein